MGWAGLLVLPHGTAAQNTSNAYATGKTVSHDKKEASIHHDTQKQGDVCFRESLGLKDVEDCPVIHSIDCILDVQVEENRQTCLPSPSSSVLLSQYAVHLTKLVSSTTTSAEPFLCIINQPIIFRGWRGAVQ